MESLVKTKRLLIEKQFAEVAILIPVQSLSVRVIAKWQFPPMLLDLPI